MTIATTSQERREVAIAPPATAGRRFPAQWGHLLPLAMGIIIAAGAICWQWSLMKELQWQVAESGGNHSAAMAAGTSTCAKQVCCLALAGLVALVLSGYATGRLLKAQALRQERRRSDSERDRLEQALFEANSALSESNQAKARFVDSLNQAAHSHLNEIVSMADMVMDGPLTDQQVELVQALRDSADSLVKVMNDSMDLSTIEVSRPELDCISFSLRCCLGDALDALGQRAKAKGLEFESSIALDVPDALQGDPGRLRQVVGNLVGNAIKFSERGKIGFKLTAEGAGEGDVQLHFVVSDKGIGVAADRVAMIARLLEDPSPVTLRRSGISGMGLLISARLARMMNGRIWLDDDAQGGCTFHFSASLKKQARCEWAAGDNAVNLRGLGVLVISSDPGQAGRITKMLHERQMQPVLAETCQGALDALKQAANSGGPLTLAILDWHVSGADSFDVAEKIRRECGAGAPAVVMLASGGRRGDARRCRKLGVAAYLTGSIKPSQLMTAVRLSAGSVADGQRPLLTRHTLREMDRRLRVLLAEGDQGRRREIASLVEGWGHVVFTVSNAPEAMLAIEREPFDVVLMDSQMLDVDAPAAFAEARRRQGNLKPVPIYAMVRRMGQSDVQRCLAAGADACLAAPLAPEALFGVLEKARSAKRSVQSASRSPSQEDASGGLGAEAASGSFAQQRV